MAQISRKRETDALAGGLARFSARAKDLIRWWAEHQAWPAKDAIRIDDRRL